MNENPFDALDDPTPDTLKAGPAPSLTDRFSINFEAGQRYNTVLGAIRDASTSTHREERKRFDKGYESFPEWQGFLEGTTALAGQLAGTAASPENFLPIGIGEKILVGSKLALSALWSRVFTGAVDAATVNGLADASIQGIENQAGFREGFDPVQWLESTFLGAVVGAGGGAVAHSGGKALEKIRAGREENPFDVLDEAAPETPEASPAPESAPQASEQPAAAPETAEAPEPASAPPVAEAEPFPPTTIGEPLSEKAAAAQGLTDQGKRILRKEAPVGRTPKKPPSLTRFLAGEGGIVDHAGELKSLGLDDLSVPGAGKLVKEGGRSLDYAREAAAEAGYFDHIYGDRETAVAKSTVADLLSALDSDVRGDRVFSSEDAGQVEAVKAHEEAKAARETLRGKLEALGPHVADTMPDDIVVRATEHMDTGLDAADAIERAIMEDYYGNGNPIPVEHADGTEIPFYEATPVRQGRTNDGRGGKGERGKDARGDGRGDAGAAKDAGADGRSARPAGERAEGAGRRSGEGQGAGDDVGEFLQMAQYAAPKAALSRPKAGAAGKAASNIGRVRETAEKLARDLGVAATRQQRIPGRQSVRGIYKVSSGVVRVRNLDDFDVLTHEYGHHVEKRVPGMTKLMKAHRKVLGILDYNPKRQDPQEGFAEFLRLWITNRAYARNSMGAAGRPFVADFEKELAKHPEIRAAIDEAERAWAEFLAAPSTAAVASTIVSRRLKGNLGRAREAIRNFGIADTIHDVLQRIYTFAFDDLNPLSQGVRELARLYRENRGQALDLKVAQDPYKLARMSRNAYAEGHMDVMYGVAPYGEINPASASLRDAIVEATGKPNGLSRWDDALIRDFGSYLWSRRALGEWDRFEQGQIPNPPDKLTKGDHEVNVAELEAANPQFVSAAEKVHDFARALWTKKHDAGLIDGKTWEDGMAIVDYVPGLRDFSADTDQKVTGRARSGGGVKTGIARRFRGSRRDVINPLESLAADAYETAMAISRNDVVKALDRLARLAGPGGGSIAEAIPVKELKATMIDPLQAAEAMAREMGLSKPDAITLRDAVEAAYGEDKMAIFRPAIINEKGEPIVFFRDGGDLRALRLADGRFGRDLYGALTMMNRHEKNFWITLLSLPARLLRFGITTSLDFLGANFVRDQAVAYIFYGKLLGRVKASLQGAADDVMGTETAKAYARMHGLSGGAETASLGEAFAHRDINKLRRRGWLAQRLTTWRGLFTITETSETASRLGLFRTFMNEARKRGLSDMEAALEASWRARDYIDFDRRGSGMAAVSRLVPFLNASMQGLDKSTRHMITPLAKKMLGQALTKEDEAAMGTAVKAWARLSAVTVASMSLYALQARNEDQDEISTQTRATHWLIRWGDKWITIPKPFELAAIINLGEASYDALVRKDPTAMSRWVDSLKYSLLPPSLIDSNPAIKSYFEVKTNTNFFTGGPIVPESVQGLEPWLQYTSRSSTIAKDLGEAFDVSPAIIDHLIANHTGSWGRSVLSAFDMAQPNAPSFAWDDAPISRRFIKDASRGSQSSTEFWRLAGERTGELEGKAKSWRVLEDSGDAAAAADYFARQDEDAKAYIAVSTMDAKVRRLQPLIRARGAIQAIGAIRRSMAAGQLRGPDGELITISAPARTAGDDILSSLSMAIARNALVIEGVPGWANRKEIPEEGFYRELEAVSPELAQRLADGFRTSKVWRFDAVAGAWPELKRRLLADGSQAETLDLVADVESQGNPLEGGEKIRRRKKPQLTLP